MSAYEYDNAGNLITVRARDVSGPVAAEYTYTNDGMLATATHGSTTLTNTWDALGNRIALSVTGTNACSYSYLYDVRAGVPAVIEEAESGGDTYYYFRDPGGVLIARRKAGVSGSWQYYHYDETGSTRLLTDGDGDVTDTYAYDAYGSVISHIGPTTDNPYQFVGALGYYTPHQDPEFRLIQTGFRFYDSETGRYTQQDPIKTGVNWYEYCYSNPKSWVDPRGDCPISIITGGIGAVVGGIWGGIDAYRNGEDVWGGIGRGIVIGGVAGLTGGLAGGAVAGAVGGGVWGGIAGGAVSGAVGDAASQVAGLALRWRDQFDPWQTATSTIFGAAVGGALWRPTTAPVQQISHWGGPIEPGSYVQVGPPSFWNRFISGIWRKYPGDSGVTMVVPGSDLQYPTGGFGIAGLKGTRIYSPCGE